MTGRRQTGRVPSLTDPAVTAGRPARRLLVLIDNSTEGMRTAEYAGRLAVSLDASLTVALVLRPPLALALAAHAVITYYPLDDVEIDVMVHLSRALDPLGVAWRLEPVTGDPSATVARLADQEQAHRVLVRREWYRPWIAWTLRRRYRLPVLVVAPARDDYGKERVG